MLLKIRSSISWRLKAAVVFLGFLQASACGFRPLYSGRGTDDAVSGQQLTQEMASVFIDEIPDRTGQILRRTLSDRITPKGEPENPHYRLAVRLSDASISEQAVRKDNLATRYVMSMSATYRLYTYPDNKLLLSDRVTNRAGYDVQRSPYATDVAERVIKERIVRIMGDDIALRLAAFLKSYKPVEDKGAAKPEEIKPVSQAETSSDAQPAGQVPESQEAAEEKQL